MHYNVLGKVRRVKFSDGRVLVYTYDASGNKLKMAVTVSGVTTTTHYVGGFVYENTTLKFFGSPEGRIVKNGSSYEYQYAIADHQGNTRVVFSSQNLSDAPVATLETANADAEQSQFIYYDEAIKINSALFDHTNNGATNYATRLIGGSTNSKYGLAKSLSVMPGDTLDIEVFAKYLDTNSSNWTTALNNFIIAIANGTAPPGTLVDGGASGSIGTQTFPYIGTLTRSNDNGTGPKAYLNYLLFDKNFVYKTGGFQRISSTPRETGNDVAHERLAFDNLVITEPGYIYIYLSNENETNVEVYFDDFKVTHTKTNVIQYNEYYPFGEATQNSWTRENNFNNYLYNAGSEKNITTGNYEMLFREYDPILGRMNAVDPMASKYASLTPYNYSFNDPVTFNDPSGADPYNGSYSGCSNCSYAEEWMYFRDPLPHLDGSGGYYGYDRQSLSSSSFAMGEYYFGQKNAEEEASELWFQLTGERKNFIAGEFYFRENVYVQRTQLEGKLINQVSGETYKEIWMVGHYRNPIGQNSGEGSSVGFAGAGWYTSATAAIGTIGLNIQLGIVYDGSILPTAYFSLNHAIGVDLSVGAGAFKVHNDNPAKPFKGSNFTGVGGSYNIGVGPISYSYGGDGDANGGFPNNFTVQSVGVSASPIAGSLSAYHGNTWTWQIIPHIGLLLP